VGGRGGEGYEEGREGKGVLHGLRRGLPWGVVSTLQGGMEGPGPSSDPLRCLWHVDHRAEWTKPINIFRKSAPMMPSGDFCFFCFCGVTLQDQDWCRRNDVSALGSCCPMRHYLISSFKAHTLHKLENRTTRETRAVLSPGNHAKPCKFRYVKSVRNFM